MTSTARSWIGRNVQCCHRVYTSARFFLAAGRELRPRHHRTDVSRSPKRSKRSPIGTTNGSNRLPRGVLCRGAFAELTIALRAYRNADETHIPSITTSALSRYTFSAHLPGSFFLNPNSFSCDQGSCSNRWMEPPRFHQPSIRSQPASGP